MIEYEDEEGNTLISETTTSWCFVGAGLRLRSELLGPEYAMEANSLQAETEVFLSREVEEDLGLGLQRVGLHCVLGPQKLRP